MGATLVKIVSDLGLVQTLKDAEALTVFAPSDEAFAKLPEGTLESLTPEQAKEIVLRHVVAAKVVAADVPNADVGTLGGEDISLAKTDEGVTITYKGGVSKVVTADVLASNGVIHVIDNVILPAPAAKVVTDLGLVQTLKDAEALTIFAPTDDAFALLPEGTLASLTPEQATAIISRHVVVGKVPAAAVTAGNVPTFGGEEIELQTANGGVQVAYNGGTSNVIIADVAASNGVIHVIDKVIL